MPSLLPRRLRPLIAAMLLTLACAGVALAQVRAEVAKVLNSADSARKAQDYKLALEQLATLKQLPELTAIESLHIHQLTAAAALGAGQLPLAAQSLQGQISTGQLSAEEKLRVLESLVNVYQRSKGNALVIQTANDYLTAGGKSDATRLALLQAHYFSKHYSEVAQKLPPYVRQTLEAGRTVDENTLRMLGHSQLQIKDGTAYLQTLKWLVARYPKRDYWADLLSRVAAQLQAQPRLELDAYRLMRETGSLEEAEDYVTLVNLALKAGYPAEAAQVVQEGYAASVLGVSKNAATHEALKARVNARVKEDGNAIAALEKLQSSATPGTAAAQLGDLHFAARNWSAAAQAYQTALAQSDVRREAETRLHLAVALERSGQTALAATAYQWPGWDAATQLLAQVWTLQTKIK